MRDFIHVSDVARANVLAFESSADGVALNIGTGEPRTVLDVANVLASTMDKDIAPEILGNFRTGDIRHCFADTTAAIETIGFKATTTFEDGVSSLIEWVSRQTVDDQFESANSELRQRGLLT
jgi:dTDP-L-rhamnose 4-epimerase